jgi:hypothetical protein
MPSRNKSILLAVLIFAFFTLRGFPLATNATVTEIYVDPPSISLDIGEPFSINVRIVDVSDLCGWQFKLYYNNTILNGTAVTEGSFLKTGGSTFMIVNFTDNFNATYGRLLASCVLTGMNVSGVSGDGVLATVSFTTKVQVGPSVLKLSETKLSDSNSDPISHQAVDGTVTVIPEFPSMITIVLFSIATLLVVIFKKFQVHANDRPGG